MFSERESSGKHLILDIRKIKNTYNSTSVASALDELCDTYKLTIITKTCHNFSQDRKAFTAIYLLAESHISVHSFPEKDAIMFDLYCCRDWGDDCPYGDITWYFKNLFNADVKSVVLDRKF